VELLGADPRLVELRHQLARARDEGAGFEDAWAPAVRGALLGATQWQQEVYAGALAGTRETWRRCYERRESTILERAASELESYAVDGELSWLRDELPAA
jgi:hypothetical protein